MICFREDTVIDLILGSMDLSGVLLFIFNIDIQGTSGKKEKLRCWTITHLEGQEII